MTDKKELEKIKQKALEERIPIIMDETLEIMGEYLTKRKPEKMLEIGTAVGYSAICFAKFLAENGHIDTIEREQDAVEILPTLNEKYDAIFIDAAKGKYPFFLKESLRMIQPDGIIFADNILYKGYVMSDYNKHKQRTAVRNLREYIKQVSENPNLETKILEVGDGLAVSRIKN